MNDDNGLVDYFLRKPTIKAWHIVLLGEVLGEKLGEKLKFPELPPTQPAEIPVFPKIEIPNMKELAEQLGKRIPRERQTKTKIFYRKNMPIKNSYDIIKTNVMGILKEFALRSPSTDFTVLLLMDGVMKIQSTYTELSEISGLSETIDAYQDTESDEYVVRIGSMGWIENCLLTIRVKGTKKFSRVLAVYDELVEV